MYQWLIPIELVISLLALIVTINHKKSDIIADVVT